MHVSVVIVCSSVRVIIDWFVHASVIISQERKEEEGSKSTRPTEARQGQQLRENRNSPNQDQDHHVETNKQTTSKLATYTLRFIIHGYACIRCHRVFVRPFVHLFVHASVIISQERKEEEGSKSTRPTEAPHHHHHHNRGQMQSVRTGNNRKKIIIIWEW